MRIYPAALQLYGKPVAVSGNFWSRWAWPWLEQTDLQAPWLPYVQLMLNVLLIFAGSLIIGLLLRSWLRSRVRFLLHKLRFSELHAPIPDLLRSLFHLIPPLLLHQLGPLMLSDFPSIRPLATHLASIYFIIALSWVLINTVRLVKFVFSQIPRYAVKPLDSYAQLINIGIYLLAGIWILSGLMDKEPLKLLTILGGTTAILLLVFKDPILGFVASIQLSANDMVRVGDWIQVDKYQANGICRSITLSTVKVQNWDKTVTHVPTYSLISESFINWRFMEELGIRRFIRTLTFCHDSVHFARSDDWVFWKTIPTLRSWAETAQKASDAASAASVLPERPTNLQAYCRYAEAYLRSHPQIDPESMLLVDQMEPSREGALIRFLAFTRQIGFVGHQQLQSEIFDHLQYVAREFGLQLYTAPSAQDVQNIFPASSQDPAHLPRRDPSLES